MKLICSSENSIPVLEANERIVCKVAGYRN